MRVEETCFAQPINGLAAAIYILADAIAPRHVPASRTGDNEWCEPARPAGREAPVDPLPYVRSSPPRPVVSNEPTVYAVGDRVQRGGAAGAVGEVQSVHVNARGKWCVLVYTSDPRCSKQLVEWEFGGFHAYPVTQGYRAPIAREV